MWCVLRMCYMHRVCVHVCVCAYNVHSCVFVCVCVVCVSVCNVIIQAYNRQSTIVISSSRTMPGCRAQNVNFASRFSLLPDHVKHVKTHQIYIGIYQK